MEEKAGDTQPVVVRAQEERLKFFPQDRSCESFQFFKFALCLQASASCDFASLHSTNS